MSDNPFLEPPDGERTVIRPAADSDRTVIRPTPGGRRPAPPPAPAATTAASSPRTPIQAPAPPLPPPRVVIPPAAAAELPSATDALPYGRTPLAAAAAPLLQLTAHLRNTVSQPDAADLRVRANRELRLFEQRAREAGVPMELLRPAHYALCATLDDAVLNTPWGSSGDWATRPFSVTLHQDARPGDKFFDQLAQLCREPAKFLPVIELMYVCLSLGFQDRSRSPARRPADIERVRAETHAIIAANDTAGEPALSPQWRGVSAPYRRSRAVVPVWVAASAALAAITGLFLWVSTGLNADSDQLYARMLAAPPSAMPQIARAGIVQPPPPPPAPEEPSALDRLRTKLQSDLDQHDVTIAGNATAPIVRIGDRALFGASGATLQRSAAPLLQRVAAALKDEPGTIQVVGYSDNQPIHTVQFPSNFQLSTARAQAVRGALKPGIGDASRLTAEGRAEADPLAPNTSAEGREQNRRVDIVLHGPE